MTVTDIQLQNGSGEIVSISAMDNDYVLESVDWGVASISAYPVRYFPTENSERILNTTWQPRTVSIIGSIIGTDEDDIDAKSRKLEDFIGVQEEIKILYNGYHLTFFPTKKVKFAFMEHDNNEALLRFQIEGTCLDPVWYNDTTVESRNFHAEPMFFFPLYLTLEEPRVVFGQQYSNAGPGNNQFAVPMLHYPLVLNEDIPAVVFGELFQSTNNIIHYDGVISTGIIFRIISTGEIRNLVIQQEHLNIIQEFTLTGTYPANTEIVIDTREGFNSVTVIGVDRTVDVAEGSVWLRLRPGINIFTYFFNSDGQVDTLIETKQLDLFEVQT